MSIEAELRELYEKRLQDLSNMPWSFEGDRFVELVFCLLSHHVEVRPELVRLIVINLKNLGLIEAENLSRVAEDDNRILPVIHYVLIHHGFSEKQAKESIKLMGSIAKEIQHNHNGKLQQLMRKKSERVRDELVDEFNNENISKEELRQAITHWLQNCFLMPISLEDREMQEYCKRKRIKVEDLLNAADAVDINLAVLDDLLDSEGTKADSKRRR